MGLLDRLRPRWKHSDPDVRKEALAGIQDAATLVDIIVRDGEWFVRHAALDALRALEPDPPHYQRLMRLSGDEEIRRKVVKVMTDEAELERVARDDKYRYIRDAAKHRLNELRTGLWDGLDR